MSIDVSEVYREHAAFVWRTLQRFGVRGAVTEDLMHDVFVIAHRKQANYVQGAAITTWLYGIARRVAANHRRKATRRSAADGARLRRVLSEPAVQEREVEHHRLAARVDEFLELLSPDKRVVFELVDMEGLSCPEVATALSLPLQQVYARLRTARRQFEAFAARLASPTNQEAR